jgi:thioredoxin-dependent peroxiredoxin
MALSIGDKAPLTQGKDQNGNLLDFSGKKTILYFYPKDDTSGCTAQACNLNENLPAIQQSGYQVIGVSVDDEKSHRKFIEKFSLKFDLIADTDHVMVEAYGVWVEKSMYGRKYMGIARTTFVIEEDATISNIIEKVDTKNHTEQLKVA